jgi:hypothetical protein
MTTVAPPPFVPNARDNLSLPLHHAITLPVEISCANLKVIAPVDLRRIRRLEPIVAEHCAMDLLPSHVTVSRDADLRSSAW